MKPATEKKVKEIAARAADLRSRYPREMRALGRKDASDDDKMITRVSAIVIREGMWLLKIVDKFIERHDINLSADTKKRIEDAREFFRELKDHHADELRKNEFILWMPVDFILHLERLAAMIVSFDANVKAEIAKVAIEDVEDEETIRREIASAMVD